MGLGKFSIREACRLYSQGYFEGMKSVIDMGGQQIHAFDSDVKEILDSFNINHDAQSFSQGNNWPALPRLRASLLWKTLGFEQCDQLDLDQNLYPDAIVCNLNNPLDPDRYLHGAYDLVTDFGNNEHPFNFTEAYRTMHRLCKTGGLMWVNQCFLGSNGFVNFHPSYFECMAAANEYEIVSCCFTVGNLPNHEQLPIPLSLDLLDKFKLDTNSQIGLNYLFRKRTSKDFAIPIQHSVSDDIDEMVVGYVQSYSGNVVKGGVNQSRAYVPQAKRDLTFREAINIIIKKVLSKIDAKKN